MVYEGMKRHDAQRFERKSDECIVNSWDSSSLPVYAFYMTLEFLHQAR